jgi:hypothetical protein
MQISDKFGSLLLTESKAVYRKDFYPKMKAVSMRVRVQTGMYITGKVRAARFIGIDWVCYWELEHRQ